MNEKQPKASSSNQPLKNHQADGNTTDTKIHCPVVDCTFVHDDVDFVIDHAKNVHKKVLYKCPECPRRLFASNVINQHYDSYHNGDTQCYFCGKEYKAYTEMFQHMSKSHQREMGFDTAADQYEEDEDEPEEMTTRELIDIFNQMCVYDKTHIVVIDEEIFAILWDRKHKRVVCAIECLTVATLVVAPNLIIPLKFKVHPIQGENPLTPKAINESGNEVGHLIPRAHHRRRQKDVKKTNTMINASPMHKYLNAGKNNSLEKHSRKLVMRNPKANVRVIRIVMPSYKNAK